MVKVSVVIPVYNAERHLNQCLNSLLNQSLKEIEIICVDDGSSDRSVEIINEYAKKDSRVKLIKQKNAYAGAARNNGMKIAQGEYMMFLDADDFFEPDMLKSMYEKSVDANADVCLCSGRRYNEKTDEYLSTTNFLEVKWLPEEDVFSSTDIKKYLFNIVSPAPWTKMFKREFVEKTGIKFQNTKKSNDLFFTYSNLALAERITYVNKEFANYRIENEGSLQGQKNFTYDFYESLVALQKELRKRGVYKDFTQSLANRALGTFFYEIDRLEDEETFKKLVVEYRDKFFYQFDILGHTRGYFEVKSNYLRIFDFYNKTPEQLWQEKLENDAQIKENIDINKWVCPIKLKNDGQIKVSVVIPVYNMEQYIEECVESVINSTLQDIEILCVNDGSTDSSLDILNELAKKDSRIKVLTKENGGLSSARNFGLKFAKGEYVLLLDSDDFIESRALEYLYAEAKNENLDQLFFSARSFNDNEYYSEADYNYDRNAEYDGVMTGKEMFIIMSDNGEFKPSACLQIIKKSFLDENDISFINGIYYEDNPFTMECLFKAQRVRYDAIKLYNRRIRTGSIMTSSSGIRSSHNYFITMEHIKKLAIRCDFSSDKEFFDAFLNQINRMCYVSGAYTAEADPDELHDFILSLDSETGMDYFFYVNLPKGYRKTINNYGRVLADKREKAIMDGYRKQCEELKQNQNSENLSAKKKIKRKLKRLYKKLRKILKKILG